MTLGWTRKQGKCEETGDEGMSKFGKNEELLGIKEEILGKNG